jgi:hypothetical protein
MSYYTDLKEYDDILFLYQRTQTINRGKAEEVRKLLDLYETHSGVKVDKSCSVCVARAMSRMVKTYYKFKEQYSKRRKGKND